MSMTRTCRCGRKYLRIYWYKHNHSAFETPKYGYHRSEWSKVVCIKCGHWWMSKAKYLHHWENPVPLLKKGEGLPWNDEGACCLNDPS